MIEITTKKESDTLEVQLWDNLKCRGHISVKRKNTILYQIKNYDIEKLSFDETDGLFRALLNACNLNSALWVELKDEIIPLSREVYVLKENYIQIHIETFFMKMGCRGER